MIQKSSKSEQFIIHNKEYSDLIKRVEDICLQVDVLNSFKTLYFNNRFEQEIIKNFINHYQDINVTFFSKIENSERKLTIIHPNYSMYLEEESTLLKIRYPNQFSTIEHKDVLGSILSLGINRNFIGDIVSQDGFVYVEVISDIARYIIDNLVKIKRAKVHLSQSNDIVSRKQEYISDGGFVKSFRLDNIVKLIIKQSNQKTRDYLLANNVKVNQVVKSDFSYQVNNEDELSLKGYGRFKIKVDENRKSKNNNYYIYYDKYK